MKVLLDAVALAGSYDQLNVASLMFVEVLLRRAAQIIEAYVNDPARPNWTGVRYMMGDGNTLNPVPHQMKAHNAKKIKDEVELENARSRRSADGGGAQDDAAGDDKGGRGPKGAGRTRELPAVPDQ